MQCNAGSKRFRSLNHYSAADKLPRVLKVVQQCDGRLGQALPRGTEIAMLTSRKAEFVGIIHERTGAKFIEPDLKAIDVKFRILPDEKRFDETRFQSVSDVMELDLTERPPYLRAARGWQGPNESVDMNDVFRVGTVILKRSPEEYHTKWDRVVTPQPGPFSVQCRGNQLVPAFLPLSANCGFLAVLDDGPYTLAEIISAHRSGRLPLPMRVQAVENGIPSCRISEKLCIHNVQHTSTLIGVKVSGEDTGKLFRVPEDEAEKIAVEEIGDWRQGMHHAIEVLLRLEDISAAAILCDGSKRSLTDPPDIPARSGGGSDDDEYAYARSDDWLPMVRNRLYRPASMQEVVGGDGYAQLVPNSEAMMAASEASSTSEQGETAAVLGRITRGTSIRSPQALRLPQPKSFEVSPGTIYSIPSGIPMSTKPGKDDTKAVKESQATPSKATTTQSAPAPLPRPRNSLPRSSSPLTPTAAIPSPEPVKRRLPKSNSVSSSSLDLPPPPDPSSLAFD